MYEDIRKLQDVDIKNKTVVVRCNFDVPFDDEGVLDDTRLKASVKTIEYLLERNCKIVLLAHLGRPEGEDDNFSLMPVRFALGHLVNKPIKFAHISACENSIKFMEEGEILLLENLRFSPEEESKDELERKSFMEVIARLCDLYVNDAFSVYRKHASVYDLPQMMRSVAGFSVQEEIEALNQLVHSDKRPYVAIVGGAKVDSKIEFLKGLSTKVDHLLLGGKMAYAFLIASGVQSGDHEFSKDEIEAAKEILQIAKSNSCNIALPIDHMCGTEFTESTTPIEIATQQIPSGHIGLDIGPKTIVMYREIIESASKILWNGPMGVFEWENFNKGTESIGEFIALSTPRDAMRIAGGSDTSYAMKLLKIKPKRFNHVSVGGGMMLEFISGKKFDVLDILVGEQSFTN